MMEIQSSKDKYTISKLSLLILNYWYVPHLRTQ